MDNANQELQNNSSNDDLNSLNIYLNEIKQNDFLSASEEIELAKRIEQGDQEAKNRLVEANLRLVVFVARQYMNNGIELLDLIQEGNMGLMHAAEKFDYRKQAKFSSYAFYAIKTFIIRAIYDQKGVIRTPVNKHEMRWKIKRAYAELTQKLMREPTDDEIIEKVGISKKQMENLADIPKEPISIHAPINKCDKNTFDNEIGDIVPDILSLSPYDIVEFHELKQRMEEIMDTYLTDRERDILRLRFGLDNEEPMVLQDVGEKFNIVRERVRQIEKFALRKMRNLRKHT